MSLGADINTDIKTKIFDLFRRRSTVYFYSEYLGPSGQSIPAQVSQTAEGGGGVFKAHFVPRSVGEHRVSVTVKGQATAGSPYAAKVC